MCFAWRSSPFENTHALDAFPIRDEHVEDVLYGEQEKKGIYSDSLLTLVFHKLRCCIKELLAFAEEKKDMPALKGKQARALYACMHLFR
jgi:hypothetical protein